MLIICGLLYVIDADGNIAYTYNTKDNTEERRGTPLSLRFSDYSSIKYNPRDQLVYAWDQTTSTAVVYNLVFEDFNTGMFKIIFRSFKILKSLYIDPKHSKCSILSVFVEVSLVS